jgi:class 3 adenylate cyclase/pimeloyl-ACP methyl ester carboxylesterase
MSAMNEPRIQYAKTTDGVNVAYATAGEGRTLVLVPSPPISHVQRGPEINRGLFDGLAERFCTIWYDARGCGLSDREPLDFSPEAMMRDLEAVIEASGAYDFCLCGWFDAVAIAVKYAAWRPEQVSQLVLVDGWFEYSDYYLNPAMQAEGALRSGDWDLYTETLARVLFGFDDEDYAAVFGAYLRTCVQPDALRMATLVLHNKNNRFLRVESGRRLATSIPGARFLEIDDMMYSQLPRLIDDFIGETSRARSVASDLPSGTAVILFADIADSTGLTEQVGDSAFREKARALDKSLRTLIRANGGSPVEGKLLGDGVLAVFNSAKQAIESSLACGPAGEKVGLALHLGIHAGDVIREADNVYGGAVNIAARIASLTKPGEVLVSQTVRDLARTSAGVSFEDRGERALKGVTEPLRVAGATLLQVS